MQSSRVRGGTQDPRAQLCMMLVGTYCRHGCGSIHAPARGQWCSTRAARSCQGCGSSCHLAPCQGTWARDREQQLGWHHHPSTCHSTRALHCWGLGVNTCWGGRGACVGVAGPSAGTLSLIQCGPRCHGSPPHCRSCRQLPTTAGLSVWET